MRLPPGPAPAPLAVGVVSFAFVVPGMIQVLFIKPAAWLSRDIGFEVAPVLKRRVSMP